MRNENTPLALALAALAMLSGCGEVPRPRSAAVADSAIDAMEALTHPAPGNWSVLLFVGTDCPVSNHYAPEIRRICAEYQPAGAQCTLVYSDRQATDALVSRHREDFGLDIPARVDAGQALATRAGATVTPQAVVYAPGGVLAYSGRINNLYAALGRPRQAATEHDLRNALDDLMAGRPVRTPRTEAIGCYIE